MNDLEIAAGLGAVRGGQSQMQIGPQTYSIDALMQNGVLTVWIRKSANEVWYRTMVWEGGGDVDWQKSFPNWNFHGSGTWDGTTVNANGTYRVGQKTNIGQGFFRAHVMQTKSDASAYAATSPIPRTSTYGSFALAGLPGESNMTMQVHQNSDLELAAGLGALFAGLGIVGPFGANPSTKVDAGTYEISGTQVALRQTPNGTEVGRFNNKYGANNNLVVEPADQVDFDGQIGAAGGLSWGHVTVKSGELTGQTGYVAMEYMAPVGWTKAHGGTGPAQGGGGGGGIEPAKQESSSTTETDYTPWILGGAGVLGLGIIAWAVLAKPKHGKRGHTRHRRHAHA